MSDYRYYDKQQQITFCGVGAHHQSGIVECCIGNLRPAARTLLVHDQRMYPSAVKTMLWSFSFVAAASNRNHYHLDAEGLSPIERLSWVKLRQRLDMNILSSVPFVLFMVNSKQIQKALLSGIHTHLLGELLSKLLTLRLCICLRAVAKGD